MPQMDKFMYCNLGSIIRPVVELVKVKISSS